MYRAYSFHPLPSHRSLVATTRVAVRQPIPSCPVTSALLLCIQSQVRQPIFFRSVLRLAIWCSFWGLVVVWGFVIGGTNGLLVRIRRLRLTEVFPFAPAIKVDERLHAAPFHHFAREPFKVDRLIGCQYFAYLASS